MCGRPRSGSFPDFDAARPRDVAYREAALDVQLWTDNVDRPTLLFASRLGQRCHLSEDGFGLWQGKEGGSRQGRGE